MRLDLTEILLDPGRSASYTIDEPALVDENVECTAKISGSLTFTNAGEALLVKGKSTTTVALVCSRCADYFEQPVVLDIDEQFELEAQSKGGHSLPTIRVVEEDESPVAGKMFDGMLFDLTELLRQYILLDEPTRPLPPWDNDRCSHCDRTASEVLSRVQQNEQDASTGNNALSNLKSLLQNTEDNTE
jgi:uncharacterized metal-binding protein YceD (DUF177 family)